jgi:hypothetical protein
MLVDLCHKVAAHPQGIYTGVRKVVQGVSHEIHVLPEVDLAQLGYRGGKVAQLMRNYFNREEVEAAKTKLKARRSSPHTSVALNTLGEKKDTRSQGHCLRSIVITQTPKWTEVDILYRSTEVTQKHTADYALFPIILDQLELAHTPRIYRLYFANCFLTALFAPILFQHTDPIEFYEFLKSRDPRYYRTFLNATAKFFEKDCRYNYKHRQKMWAIAREKLDCRKLAEYCKMNGASFNEEGLFDAHDL